MAVITLTGRPSHRPLIAPTRLGPCVAECGCGACWGHDVILMDWYWHHVPTAPDYRSAA